MTVVLDLVVSVLAGVSLLFTLYFAWRAFAARSKMSYESYGVGQQRARMATQVNIVWSIVLLIVSFILLGVSGFSFGPAEVEPIVPATDTSPLLNTATPAATTAVPSLATATATPTLAPLSTIDLGDTPLPTTVAPPPTLTPAPVLPTSTPTSAPATAVVNSGVGVWLRAEPSTAGEQLEWVLDGTVLTLLPGRQQGDDFEWQQVRTAEGNEGWVATDFIIYNDGN